MPTAEGRWREWRDCFNSFWTLFFVRRSRNTKQQRTANPRSGPRLDGWDIMGQLSSKVGESSKIPDMSGFPRPSLVSGRVLEENRNILIQTQECTEKPRICLQLSYICHTFVYKNKAHSRASCAAVLKRFASRLKLF